MYLLHRKCLQGIYGVPSISMEKGGKNHRETLYSSKAKIACVVGKPGDIYKLQGNPIVMIGLSLQSVNITGVPTIVYQRTAGPLGPVLQKIQRTGPFRTSKLPKGPLRTSFFIHELLHIWFFKMDNLEF